MPGFMQAKYIVYQSEREVRQALIQVSLYICFLVVTTIIALSTQHVNIFYFNQAIERAFPGHAASGTNLRFKEVVSISEWWKFLEGTFIFELNIGIKKAEDLELIKQQPPGPPPKATGSFYEEYGSLGEDGDGNKDGNLKKIKTGVNEQTSTLPNAVRAFISQDNLLLGVPKLRQIRVKNNSCPVYSKFQKYFSECYAQYSFASEDQQPFYKDTRFYKRTEYKAAPVSGNLLKYNGPGYMLFLNFSLPENMMISTKLKSQNWIDVATRLVVLEFVVYNANTHLFNNVKLMVEVLPVGGVLPKWTTDVVPLYTIWSPRHLKTLLSAIIFYLLVVYYTSVEIKELLKDGFSEYFGNAQNYVDITILLMSYIALTLTMIQPFLLDKFISSITEDPQALVSLDDISFWFSCYIYVMAICVFMVWSKIFRFVSFNKTLLQFSTTLRRCSYDILGFAAMFLVVFIAFSIFGNMVFGSSNPSFSSFQASLFTMVRMVLGDFPYEKIEKANRVLGPIFCLTYVMLITFIMLNMFLAIINETYSTVKEEITEDHSALKNFIVNLIERVTLFIRRCLRPDYNPNKKEETPTSSLFKHTPQDDTHSMYEFDDVPLSGVGFKNNTKRKLRSRGKSLEEDEDETAADEFAQDVERLNERINTIEGTINRLRDNMNRLFGRINEEN